MCCLRLSTDHLSIKQHVYYADTFPWTCLVSIRGTFFFCICSALRAFTAATIYFNLSFWCSVWSISVFFSALGVRTCSTGWLKKWLDVLKCVFTALCRSNNLYHWSPQKPQRFFSKINHSVFNQKRITHAHNPFSLHSHPTLQPVGIGYLAQWNFSSVGSC